MTPEEKAAAIGAAIGDKTITYSYQGITFRVSNCIVTGPAVQITVAAWTGAGGNRVDLPTDNPYIFVNPPVLVPDGGTTAISVPNPGRGGGNINKTVASFTRNDVAAAQQIVYDAVTAVAKRLGWTP